MVGAALNMTFRLHGANGNSCDSLYTETSFLEQTTNECIRTDRCLMDVRDEDMLGACTRLAT